MHTGQVSQHIEVLDRVYVCRSCGVKYIFRSETHDHEMSSGHRQFNEIKLNIEEDFGELAHK